MSSMFLLTCEHAGNELPKEYAHLFSGNEEVLYSHKAIDLGALRLARHISTNLNIPLHYTTTTRLLVEANRSPDDEELFSEFVKNQPQHVKTDIMKKYYWPHRKKVEDEVRSFIAKGSQVIHVALHTFAPVAEGEVRDTDIGILFDPNRTEEQAFADDLKSELLALNPKRQIDKNRPYPGHEDCFPRYLRQRLSPNNYLGFEIEINQKFFLDGEPDVWNSIVREVTTGLETACRKRRIA